MVHKITTEEPAALPEDADPQLAALALKLLDKRLVAKKWVVTIQVDPTLCDKCMFQRRVWLKSRAAFFFRRLRVSVGPFLLHQTWSTFQAAAPSTLDPFVGCVMFQCSCGMLRGGLKQKKSKTTWPAAYRRTPRRVRTGASPECRGSIGQRPGRRGEDPHAPCLLLFLGFGIAPWPSKGVSGDHHSLRLISDGELGGGGGV